MASSNLKTIQGSIERLNPKDEAFCETLGLNERQVQFFWAALNAVADDDLAIPDFNKLMAKLSKYSSVDINELRKRGVIRRGKNRGEWFITDKAVQTLDSLMSGRVAPATKVPSRRVGKVKKTMGRPTKSTRKTTQKTVVSAKLQRRIEKLTVEQIADRLREINSQSASLKAEKAMIADRLSAVLADLKNELD